MVYYLAYRFGPEQLTKNRLGKIMDEYFDFEIKTKVKSSVDWFRHVEETIKIYERRNLAGRKAMKSVKRNWLSKASHFAIHYNVKNRPQLEIWITEYDEGPYTPEEFSGLSITANHSGSEGYLKLLEVSREMPGFLVGIGLKFEDCSKVSLD